MTNFFHKQQPVSGGQVYSEQTESLTQRKVYKYCRCFVFSCSDLFNPALIRKLTNPY